MKITFDAGPLADRRKTGMGYSLYYILRNLIKIYPEHEYSFNLLYSRKYKEKPENLKSAISKLGKYKVNDYKNIFSITMLNILQSIIPIPYSFYFNDKSDITHFHSFFIPPGVKGKKVVVIHDMAHKIFPMTISTVVKTELKLLLKTTCKRADKILTNSEFSKSEIIKYLNVSQDKIVVTLYGVDTDVFYPMRDKNSIDRVRKKYDIPKDYFLYIGFIGSRKNTERLVRAYALLKQSYSDIPVLVLAGAYGINSKMTLETVFTLGMEKYILFPGYVADEDIRSMICGARAFVYPSLYEGFGMPVLEAMACGVPVLTSNMSSLPEIAGDAAVLIDPMEIEDIANGLKRFCDDEGLCADLAYRGLKRAREFTWERTAVTTMDVYKNLV
jgi:glycosyltransferase involved in cell wall biosynthesis